MTRTLSRGGHVNASALRDPVLWLWGIVAPVPVLVGAGAVGGFVGSAVDDAWVGVLVFLTIVALAARKAFTGSRYYLVAFAAGGTVAFFVAAALLIASLSTAHFG
jgi:hypothetical protein